MKRQSPVLTSPWKIGFFVSLMLVVVSAAVSYFFIRQSGFAGTLPHWTSWRSIVDSVTPPNGAVIEYWPLLAVVGLSVLIAYFTITQAVARYKAYLDSGHDYRDLLNTIREIKDLEDHKKIAMLHNYPKLRDFLVGVRETVAEREHNLDKRETELEARESEANADSERAFHEQLAADCERLVDAIGAIGGSGLPESIDLSYLEMQQVARALRVALADTNPAAAPTAALGDVVRELESGIATGREIEKHLQGVAENVTTFDTAAIRDEMESLTAALSDASRLAGQVGDLDEDTKAVAIKSALKAGSGEGTQADLIELADEVKEIATRFGSMAGVWPTIAEALTSHVRAIEAELGRAADSLDGFTGAGTSLGTAAEKLSRCVEHLAVVADKVRQASGAAPAPSGQAGPKAEQRGDETGDAADTNGYGFETIERVRPLFSTEAAETAEGSAHAGDAAEAHAPGDAFEKQPDQVIPETPEEEEMFAEMPSTDGDAAEFNLDTHTVDLPGDDAAAATTAPDDDVIDLYELGAVDYDPAVHA